MGATRQNPTRCSAHDADPTQTTNHHPETPDAEPRTPFNALDTTYSQLVEEIPIAFALEYSARAAIVGDPSTAHSAGVKKC